jgi:hypothetical protein
LRTFCASTIPESFSRWKERTSRSSCGGGIRQIDAWLGERVSEREDRVFVWVGGGGIKNIYQAQTNNGQRTACRL